MLNIELINEIIFSHRCDYTTGSLGILSAFYSTPETDIFFKKNIFIFKSVTNLSQLFKSIKNL